VLAYATVYGHLVGWDLRANATAWQLHNDFKLGIGKHTIIFNYDQAALRDESFQVNTGIQVFLNHFRYIEPDLV
jgi:uncharacterized protein (UPF0548 family)